MYLHTNLYATFSDYEQAVLKFLSKMARREGLEPSTRSLEGCCSNPTELPPRSKQPKRLPESGQADRKLANQVSKLGKISRKSAGQSLIDNRDGIVRVQRL